VKSKRERERILQERSRPRMSDLLSRRCVFVCMSAEKTEGLNRILRISFFVTKTGDEQVFSISQAGGVGIKTEKFY